MRDILKRHAIVAVISFAVAIVLATTGLPPVLIVVVAILGGSAYEFFAAPKAEKKIIEALEHAQKAMQLAEQTIEQQRVLINEFAAYFANKARQQEEIL